MPGLPGVEGHLVGDLIWEPAAGTFEAGHGHSASEGPQVQAFCHEVPHLSPR